MSQLEVDKIIPQSGTTLTIGDSGDTITIASGATLSGSLNADNLDSGTVPSARVSGAYTGITSVGNLSFADSETLTFGTGSDFEIVHNPITGNLLNLTSSPLEMHQQGTNSVLQLIKDSGNHNEILQIYKGTDKYGAIATDTNLLKINAESALSFSTNSGSERMRITSDGKVGIRTSSPEEILDLSADNNVNVRIGNRTYIGAGRSDAGTILGHTVKADTTATTGSSPMVVTESNSGGGAPSAIRMQSGNIQFHTASGGTEGATFDSERMRIYETGAVLLGTTTVGSAGAGDLSVNGGIFLGGTGTANKLDDYEEGTWTPEVIGFTTSSSNGYYRKIGSQVTVWFKYTSTTNLGAGGAYYDLRGLPFTPTHYGGSFGLVKYHTNTLGRGVVVSCNSYETTKFRIQVFNTSATGNVDAQYDDSLTGMATFFID